MESKPTREMCVDDAHGCLTSVPVHNRTEYTTAEIDPDYAMYLSNLKVNAELPVGLITLVTSLIYSMGILANVCLLAYLIKFKRYRSPMFVIILSLALCDTGTCMSGLLGVNVIVYKLLGPPWLCSFFVYLICICFLSSTWHMVFFSIMRFYQLVFPLKALTTVTVSLVGKICACLWFVTALFTIGVPRYYSAASVTVDGRVIYFCRGHQNDYQIVIETLYLLIPNILMITFHLAKHFSVRKQSKASVSEQHGSEKRQSTDARAVTIVIVVFCVTSWPQLIQFYLHYVFGYPRSSYHILLNAISSTLEYINSAFNPWIYVFCAQSVRKDVIGMFASWCGKK